jgi:predicted short-subunit dehydrogenase-like oxidoreductase (DUF2520 family)
VAVRLAIVGPGRVGQVLGRLWAEAGIDLLGFVGRSPAGVAAAVRFCGRGRALALADLATARVVVFAVGDPDLPAAVAAVVAAVPRRGPGLWLHTSGRYGTEVLGPLRGAGVRLGALHPAAPIADAVSALRRLAGQPAVLLGDEGALGLLRRLALRLQMRPLLGRPGDRLLYHAACALAANGLTALRAAVDEVLATSGVLAPADGATLAQALMASALRECGEQGPAAALSGPVVRGDDATVAAHRAALRRQSRDLDDVYRALMAQALRLGEQRGLPVAAAAALRRALAAVRD